MNGSNQIKLPLIDLGNFIRIIYPGVLLATFIYWHHSEAFGNNLSFIFGIMALIFGVGFYALYRGALYYPIVRNIEAKIIGIPQYEFHLSVAEKLKAPQKVKTIAVASACLSNVLMTKASPEFRAQNTLFNSFVHALFLTAFLCFFFFLHDIALLGFKLLWVWLWPLASILFFGAGIGFDKQADLRETLFLQQNRGEYEKVLYTYIN